jgi:glycosyltransferase involved in cell wall biosynthesis
MRPIASLRPSTMPPTNGSSPPGSRCVLLVVPPGAEAGAALLLGLEREKLRGLPSGVELERFSRRPLAEDERFAFWREWLVEQPRGWDQSGRPGSIAYRDEELAPFRSGGPVFLYVGRFTAVKRLPLLISAHARAVERLDQPVPLVLVGGHPGEWEGEHPLATARRIGNRPVFLAGWRPTSSSRRRRALGRGRVCARSRPAAAPASLSRGYGAGTQAGRHS